MAPIITAKEAVLEGDTLVMLVKNQQVHLGTARTIPALRARMILCGLPVTNGEVIGAVGDEDLSTLQDFTICPACASEFVAHLRDGMLARVRAAQLAIQPPLCAERRHFEANQLQLF